MAGIADIVQQQSYVGNAGAAGGSNGAIILDTKPIEKLAEYTMFYNKAEYDQRQKDIDAKVVELANFTALDLNGTRAKDKDFLLGQWSEVQKASEEYARYTPTSQSDKVEKQLEYEAKLKKLTYNVQSGTQRAIAYNMRLNAINNNGKLSANEKNSRIQDLNKDFDNTDITTPIPAEDGYEIDVPKIGPPVYSKNQITQKDANGFLTSAISLFAPKESMNASFAEENGLIIEPLPANATDAQRREYEAKVIAYKKAGHTLYKDSAVLFNDALNNGKYKKADGTVDYEAIKASNPLLASTVKLIDDWNSYSARRKDQIQKGQLFDATGNPVIASLYNADDYFQIDKTKPLTGSQLIFLQKFKDAVPDGKSEKYDYTGEDIAKKKLAIEWYDNKTKRMAATAKTPVDVPVIERPAWLVARHIETLKDFFDKHPVVKGKPDQQLQVRYTGLDENTRSAAGVKEGQSIKYFRNGRYEVIDDATNRSVSAGTIEDLAKGFTDAVRTITIGENASSEQTADFLTKSENMFNKLWGTNRVQTIWDNTVATKKSSGSNDIPTVTSQAEYNQLKSGQIYIENGKKFKKP